MDQTRANKFRGLATGFFGWFLTGNLSAMIYPYSPVYEIVIYGFGIITFIAIIFLFYMKRNWIGYGIVTAVITNAIVWMIFLGGFDWFWVLTPLPIGLYIGGL